LYFISLLSRLDDTGMFQMRLARTANRPPSPTAPLEGPASVPQLLSMATRACSDDLVEGAIVEEPLPVPMRVAVTGLAGAAPEGDELGVELSEWRGFAALNEVSGAFKFLVPQSG
jgi:hypothetical protein